MTQTAALHDDTSSTPFDEFHEISPELILVSPPKEAERARALLPEVVLTDWPRSRPEGSEPGSASPSDLPAEQRKQPERPSSQRRSRPTARGVLVAVATCGALVAVAAAGFAAGRRDNASGDVPSLPATDAAVSPDARPSTGRRVAPRANSVSRASPPEVVARGGEQPANTGGRSALSSPTGAPTLTAPRGGVESQANGGSSAARAHAPHEAQTSTAQTSAAQASTARTFVPSRVFVWPAVPQATYYVVRFFRNGRKVIEGRPSLPEFRLPTTFRFTPGSYRWVVVAAFGPPAQARLGAPIVDSTFELSKQAAPAPGP